MAQIRGGVMDKGRGWIYLLIDKSRRVIYVGSTQGFIPVRALLHAKRARLARVKYTGSKEALQGYNGVWISPLIFKLHCFLIFVFYSGVREGFGEGRRHECVELARVDGDIAELELREGYVQASGFWMCLRNKQHRCWENNPRRGFNVAGVESFRVRMRHIVQV